MEWKAVMKGSVYEMEIHNIIRIITTKLTSEKSSKM